jgi:hypothetical protein
VNRQDQQAIDDLFQHLSSSAAQAGPRDPQAEARIQQHIQRDPAGLVYQMAQTLVGQQAALRQLRAQLADAQQQLQHRGRWAGFGRHGPSQRGTGQRGTGQRGAGQRGAGQRGAGQQGYGRPYQQPAGYQQAGGGGFLAGAGQIALGVGGGILAAEALGSLFSGDGLFGNDYNDDRAFDQGYEDGRQDQERYDDNRQDDNNQNDGGAQYDDNQNDGGGYDDGGGFDGGGFDDGGGW